MPDLRPVGGPNREEEAARAYLSKVSPATFLKLFRTFSRVDPNEVEAQLTLAAVEMGGPDFSVWPPFATLGPTGQANQPLSISDLAHGYLTAHLLQTSPMGGPTRLAPEATDGRSSYLDRFETLMRSVGCGPLVAGTGSWGILSAGSGASLNPGSGFAGVTNGSTAVAFTMPQTLPAGTVLAFVGAQPGALYVLSANIADSMTGVLTAIYTGITNAASMWNYGTI